MGPSVIAAVVALLAHLPSRNKDAMTAQGEALDGMKDLLEEMRTAKAECEAACSEAKAEARRLNGLLITRDRRIAHLEAENRTQRSEMDRMAAQIASLLAAPTD